MIRSLKNIVIVGALTVAAVGFFGCGSGSNNNQGVSFTLLGFFETFDGEDPELVEVVPLSNQNESDPNESGNVFSFAGSMNNLSQQFIRTDGMYLSYFIPGATRQPPDTATAYSVVLGPAVDTSVEEGEDPFDSSLPPSFAGEDAPSNISRGLVSIVPADIREWLNLNRNSLPELPFDMVVTAYASGITSSGDRLDTNEVQFLVKFTTDVVIPPANEAPEGGDNATPVSDSDTTTTG